MSPRPIFSTELSRVGLVAAIAAFALSLTPSLIPRAPVIQGVLSGITLAIGYGLGAGVAKLWQYLEFPAPRRSRAWTTAAAIGAAVLGSLLLANVWRHLVWQNEIRDLFGMDRVTVLAWLVIVPVAVGAGALCLVLARLLGRLLQAAVRLADRVLPRRAAVAVGTFAVVVVLWALWSGVLVNGFFLAANAVFAPLDARIEADVDQPTSSLRSGSDTSLVAWEDLGRTGRQFVSGGPTVEELEAFAGPGALEPIRVYAGLDAAPTAEDRARLLVDELERTGAFERSVLVLGTTTGTGKLVAAGIDPLEYIHGGDTAVVGIQYSYLPSWMSLLGDHDEVRDATKVTFDIVHDHWATLPVDSRPELYVYGLSLGTLGVEAVLGSVDTVNEPIDGALLVGPTFVNDVRSALLEGRDAGSSPVTPIYEQGRTVRFTNEANALDLPTGEWGDTKVVYVQHGSDPIGFFSIDLLWSSPDWLEPGQRGVDVSDAMRWVPGVTMWQVLSDLAASGSVPSGFGHEYSARANADGWIAITEPDGWTGQDTERLAAIIAGLGQDG